MRIKILVTGIPPYHIGGTETQAYNFALNLAKKHDVVLYTRREKGAEKETNENGFIIRRFGYINFPVIRFFSHIFSALNELRKVRHETDVIFCFMLSPNGLVGTIAKKMFGLKTIASIRGGDWYTPGFVGGLINRYVIKKSNLIAVQKEKIKREVLEKFQDVNVDVITNGIYLSKLRANGNKIVFLGNIQKRKGVHILLEAMKQIDNELIIFGDGPYKETLQKLSKEMGLTKKVKFNGRIKPEDVKGKMCCGRVFVLPSVVGEGLPNVIQEAMSIGLPVVSTRISGIPDIIDDGKTGFLVEPGDPKALATVINRILRDNRLHKKMSENCLKEIEKYSWNNIISKIEKSLMKVHLNSNI